jgi:hypothetical protein
MYTNDFIGLSFLLLLFVVALYGLHRVSKPRDLTQEEYLKRLKKSSGIARGAINALMYPLQELWHPKAVEAVHIIKDVRQGYYDGQQESGEGSDDEKLQVAAVFNPYYSLSKPNLAQRISGRLIRGLRKIFGHLNS